MRSRIRTSYLKSSLMLIAVSRLGGGGDTRGAPLVAPGPPPKQAVERNHGSRDGRPVRRAGGALVLGGLECGVCGGELLAGGRTHLAHRELDADLLARQGVIQVEVDRVGTDVEDLQDEHRSGVVLRLEAIAWGDLRRELRAIHLEDGLGIPLAVGVSRSQGHDPAISGAEPVEGLLLRGEELPAPEDEAETFGLAHRLPLSVEDGEIQGHEGVGPNLILTAHGKKTVRARLNRQTPPGDRRWPARRGARFRFLLGWAAWSAPGCVAVRRRAPRRTVGTGSAPAPWVPRRPNARRWPEARRGPGP